LNPALEILGLTHAYGNRQVLAGLDLRLDHREIVCLLGPSGCGKSTLLRCIAGFEPLLSGKIFLNGRLVGQPGEQLPPEQRRVGVVFQDFALFPHLTVAENIAFGLHAWDRVERENKVRELLEVVQLAEVAGKHPHELSGGQQQRAALARALAPQPDLLLLDEPFSNLDPELRELMKHEVRRILKTLEATALIVTHDQNEAFDTADRIALMGDRRVQQIDSAYNLYHKPANRFVAGFVGRGVLIRGELLACRDGRCTLATELGELDAPALPIGTQPPGTVDVLVRPDDVVHDDASPRQAKVVARAFRGTYNLFTLELASGQQLLCLAPSHHNHAVGSQIGIRLELDHVIAFPQKS
jgi:iron(III) transport system ATP-binding protein